MLVHITVTVWLRICCIIACRYTNITWCCLRNCWTWCWCGIATVMLVLVLVVVRQDSWLTATEEADIWVIAEISSPLLPLWVIGTVFLIFECSGRWWWVFFFVFLKSGSEACFIFLMAGLITVINWAVYELGDTVTVLSSISFSDLFRHGFILKELNKYK